MRIISSEKDYIDGFSDPTDSLLYIRNETNINIPLTEYKINYHRIQMAFWEYFHKVEGPRDKGNRFYFNELESPCRNGSGVYYISICEIPYIFIYWARLDNKQNKTTHTYTASLDDFKKTYIDKCKTKHIIWTIRKPIADVLSSLKKLNKIHYDYKVPVFMLYPDAEDKEEKGKHTITLNPVLKPFGLSKLLPAPNLYQTIDMFLGNNLVESINNSVKNTGDDKVLIASKGFDTKKSFRKDPQTDV